MTSDPVGPLILSLAVILTAAKLGGHIASRMSQPPVLGELIAGVALGNLMLAGVPSLEYLKTDPGVDVLARLGVILLLFQVGLEATVGQMMKVGLSSLLVATLGVIDQNLFSAVVVMVIVTTLMTPPALKWSFDRFARRQRTCRTPHRKRHLQYCALHLQDRQECRIDVDNAVEMSEGLLASRSPWEHFCSRTSPTRHECRQSKI